MSYLSWWQNNMDEFGNTLVGGDDEGDTISKGKKRKQCIEALEVFEKKIKVGCVALVTLSGACIDPSLGLQFTSEPTPKDVPESVPQLEAAPRDLFDLHWHKQIKRGGKTDEFNNYYRSLTPDQCGKYDEVAKILVLGVGPIVYDTNARSAGC
ncbi:hypothetical protein BD769DRAFT_1395851 [Suillus cothurnatus]|nr:hypothetical protein BD769DRAFT_1395851 [Suillus cothurnatus]